MKNVQHLAQCNLFSCMQACEIEAIFQKITVSEATFAKGDILAFQDEPCNRLIILISGSIEAQMTDPSGKVVKVEDVFAPSPLAILFLFGSQNRFPVQVTAREAVTALIVTKSSVLKMLSSNERLLENYLNISAIYASKLYKKLHLMSFRTIRQKLAIYLLDLLENSKQEVEMNHSQHELATYFAVSRPSLARELYKMQEDGLIEINKKKITIKDRQKLIQIVKFT